MVAGMRVQLIAALIASHGVTAYTPGETSDNVGTYSDRHAALQRTPTSLDNLMSRADENILSSSGAERQPGPPERSECEAVNEQTSLLNAIPSMKF